MHALSQGRKGAEGTLTRASRPVATPPAAAADPSLTRFRAVLATAYAELERRRQEVNDLNVFPVADGDTGDNMSMTLRAVLDELDALGTRPIDQIGRDEVVHAVARASLLGARGNSGVILSQIVRGAAEELASRPGELVDPVLVSAAFARAVDAAYASVREPAEGTMLSAVRAMAHRVAQDLAHMSPQRLGPDVDPAEQDALLADVLDRALDAGREAVRRGPEQLAALREADVVDAGAYGLVVIVAGVAAALRGAGAPVLPHEPPPRIAVHGPQHESTRYRYCTNFAVSGEGLDAAAFAPALEALGDSVLVVGDERTLRVHVHTDDPDGAAAVFRDSGEVSRFEFDDMRVQEAGRIERLTTAESSRRCAVVAVGSGAGLVRLYEELGAQVVDAGASLNPSTGDLLAAVAAAPGREVVVLANSPNVVLAAERAAELAERPARVVATEAPQAGLAALVAFDPDGSAEANARAVGAAAGRLRTGGVAEAARDDAAGRFRAGDAVGYSGDELIAWGEPQPTLAAVIADIARGRELVTCLAGDRAPLERGQVEAAMPDGVELDYHSGGQPAWWWLVCAE